MTESISPRPPPTRRVVTGHDASGNATVKMDTPVKADAMGDSAYLTKLWISTENPPNNSTETDGNSANAGSAPDDGPKTSFITYDIPPHYSGPLHRSVSLDHVVVLRGSVVLGLDDGSKVTMNEGDTVVQRGTMHQWSNETDQWARLLGVTVPANPVIINGTRLERQWPF